jgi:hypothetical protein
MLALIIIKSFLVAEHLKCISAFVCLIHRLTSAYDNMAPFMLSRLGRGFHGINRIND